MKGFKGLSYLIYQEDIFKQFLNNNTGMKVLIEVDFSINTKDEKDAEDTEETPFIKFRSRRFEILNTDDISDVLSKMAQDIIRQISSSYLRESGITINKIERITIHYDKYNPTRAGSYIELPKWVSSKKACINIKNEDNKCFKYCVQCSVFKIYEKDNPERMRHYNKLNDTIINWVCMKFPCSRKDIDRFEEENPGLISVNVNKLRNKTTITYRITKVKHAEHHINLLMIEQ